MKVKTLLAVIESGSYTKAAQKLNLTQPAVSHQIRLLENEFDIKIFYRSKEVTIGRESHIGANSVVVAGGTIGERRPQGGCRLFQRLPGY